MPIQQQSNLRAFLRTVLVSLVTGGGLFWIAETTATNRESFHRGVFWMAGDNWWAPDYGLCSSCGGPLITLVDEASACRHCFHCNVSFRHASLPKTLVEQDRVWK